MPKTEIHPVDRYVGQRLRLRRVACHLSQTQLGDKSGITFQQVQKYEKGTNRVSASRIAEFAEALGVEPAYFFEGAPRAGEAAATELPIAPPREDVLKMCAAFDAIKSPAMRKAALKVVRSMLPKTE